MSARVPIKPSEIRKGDLIRKEYGVEVGHGELALEYRATSDSHGKGGPGQHYLLDRPTPAVELPTEPTLGTVDWSDDEGKGTSETGLWWRNGEQFRSESSGIPVRFVTNFTPILTHADDETAVPAEAIDVLRNAARSYRNGYLDVQVIDDFLRAVDKAAQS